MKMNAGNIQLVDRRTLLALISSGAATGLLTTMHAACLTLDEDQPIAVTAADSLSIYTKLLDEIESSLTDPAWDAVDSEKGWVVRTSHDLASITRQIGTPQKNPNGEVLFAENKAATIEHLFRIVNELSNRATELKRKRDNFVKIRGEVRGQVRSARDLMFSASVKVLEADRPEVAAADRKTRILEARRQIEDARSILIKLDTFHSRQVADMLAGTASLLDKGTRIASLMVSGGIACNETTEFRIADPGGGIRDLIRKHITPKGWIQIAVGVAVCVPVLVGFADKRKRFELLRDALRLVPRQEPPTNLDQAAQAIAALDL